MSLLFAALLIADPATAAPATPSPQVATAPIAKKEKTICKSFDDSASRLGRRVCKKESEWATGGADDDNSGSPSSVSARPRN
jgi:hypothetical protein